MAVNQIMPVEAPRDDSPSALQNFATAMGLLTSLGGLGLSAYGTFNPKPDKMDELMSMLAGAKGGGKPIP